MKRMCHVVIFGIIHLQKKYIFEVFGAIYSKPQNMFRFRFSQLFAIILLAATTSDAQRYVLIEGNNDNPPDIYEEIMGDVASNGSRVDDNTVYQLQNGYVYHCSDLIETTSDWALQIEAEDLNNKDQKPIIKRNPDKGGNYHRLFNVYSNMTLKNLWIIQGEEDPGVNYTWGSIRLFSEGGRIVLEDCVMEKDRGGFVQFRADKIKLYATDCHFRNAVQFDAFEGNGRVIDTRTFYADSIVVKNCVMYNITDRILRSFDTRGDHNYIEFDHNTIFRHTGRNGGFQFESVKELKITNNLLLNPCAYGNSLALLESSIYFPDVGSVFLLQEQTEGASYTFANNNIAWSPELLAYWDSNDSVDVPSIFSDTLIAALGGEAAAKSTSFSEWLTLHHAPDQNQDVIDFVAGSYSFSSASAVEMIAAGIVLHTEDISRAGEATDYHNLFDYSSFNHSYDVNTRSATAATDGSPVGASWSTTVTSSTDILTDQLKVRINNPVRNGILSVSMEKGGRTYASIIDLTGRTRISKTLNEGSFKLNVNTLEQGLYLLHLKTGSSFKTVKFCKY
jgi:hypothetical protein